MRKTLEEVYGADQVSLVSATFRWLNHHSAMKPENNGESSGIKHTVLYVSCVAADGIILGGSKLNHLVVNMDACEEGPLDERKFIVDQLGQNRYKFIAGVVKAFDEAWFMDKAHCPKYFR